MKDASKLVGEYVSRLCEIENFMGHLEGGAGSKHTDSKLVQEIKKMNTKRIAELSA